MKERKRDMETVAWQTYSETEGGGTFFIRWMKQEGKPTASPGLENEYVR